MKSIPLLLAVLILLSGCSTFEGLKSDLTSGYNSIASAFDKAPPDPKEEKRKLPVYDGTCPPVSVRPDLSSLTEFYDPVSPSDKSKISEISITNVRGTCRVEKDGLVMQVDLSFAGRTGPKARAKSSDKPSFAYPYFVAVTDAQGIVISKEIFAASVSYGAEQNSLTLSESIFQSMPFPDPAAGKVYSVVVGFQLTPEQLSYNQTHGVGSAPVSIMPRPAPVPNH